MITIFNRKEVITTYDVEEYANARDDLKEAGIEFKIKAKLPMFKAVSANKNITYMGRKYATEYTIFVKEEDYNRAVHIIHNKEGWK